MASLEKTAPDHSFDGSSWDKFLELAGYIEFAALFDPEKFDTDVKKCAFAAAHFTGPALAWVMSKDPFVEGSTFLANWSNFQQSVQLGCCGIADQEQLRVVRQKQLDDLKVLNDDWPTFFADFERLTLLIGIKSDISLLTVLRQKLPRYYQDALAVNGINHVTYNALRKYLLNVSGLRPGKDTTHVKPKCEKCGKKGHTASTCRSKN